MGSRAPATAPMSIVLSMAYTESLFCALVLGMFYAARRNAYLIAGVLGFLAGMTRPTGLAAALALVVERPLGLGVPEYKVEEAGPDHAKVFTAWAVVAGERYGGSEGRSKKEAEQRAAEAAWRQLSDLA